MHPRRGTTFDRDRGSLLTWTVRVLCIVPSRIGSTRLPAKPLRLLAGEPLVRHVVRRVVEFDFGPVLVATDDERVVEAVVDTGARAVMTDADCGSGTERVAAALRQGSHDVDVVVNVQGDEPLIPREAVLGAIERVSGGDDVGTAAGLLDAGLLRDPDRVKVEVDGRGRARRFFRHARAAGCAWGCAVFQHIGVYAYRPRALARWVDLPPVAGERDERLEQLRPLAYGMTIGVAALDHAPPTGVDTEADLRAVERHLEVLTGG